MNSKAFGISILSLALSLVCFSQPNSKGEFQSILEKIGNEHPRVLSAQYQALSTKSAQLANLLTWTPSLGAVARRPLEAWGTEGPDIGSVTVSLNLIRFGGDVSRFQAARKARAQADLVKNLTVLEAEERAARLIFQWIALQNTLESQQAFLKSQLELLRVAQNRYRLGQLPLQDVEKARLDVNNQEIRLRQAEVQLLDLKSQLEAWMPGVTGLRTWPWSTLASASGTKKALPLTDRMNFKRLQLETDLRSASTFQATTDLLPTLGVESTWSSTELSPPRNGEWSSFLVLTIPIWDSGQSWFRRSAAADLVKAAQFDLEAYRLEEEARMRTLNERREKLHQNLAVALDSNQRAKALAGESLRRFQIGRANVNDVFLDQQRVLSAETLAQEALGQYHLILLESCLGADERPSKCF